MKKTLAAIAVLGAFAGSALAADVTLYGKLDTGLQYNHVNNDKQSLKGTATYKAANKTTNKLSMESGQSSGARWGLKGVEDLGAFKVGFILEDGFAGDTGAEGGVMFDRESSLFIEGAFGKLAVGRIGSINNGTSSWAQLGATSAFGTSYKKAAVSQILVADKVRDNMIAYQTPNFAGVTGFVQYSSGDEYDKDAKKVEGTENESTKDRYYAVGAKYANGPLNAYVAVDSINYLSSDGTNAFDTEDSLTVTAAVNYNFDVAKVYFAAQYFDEVKGEFGQGKVNGYALTASVSAPVAGGNLMGVIGYVDAEAADSVTDVAKTNDLDFTRYQIGVGYTYPLSKRTYVYGAAAMLKDKTEYAVKTKGDDKVTAYQAQFGLVHNF